MEAAALEQTLREHPDDLSAWMVYGDWLLERDDARGTLIQLEHRHARARAEERPALKRKIDALVKRHQAAWRAALPKGVDVQAWRYGFATKVEVPWSEDAPRLLERALREPFVTALRVVAPGLGEGLEDVEVDEDGEEMPPFVDVGGLATLDLQRLRELDLRYANIGAPGAKALAGSRSLGGLEALDLRYGRIGDEGLEALAASALAGSVRRLYLQRNEITAAGARALRRFERLVELDLRYNDLGAAGAQALLEAPFIGALARLGLYRGDVSDAGVRELARSSRLPPALRSYWRSL